MTYDLDAIKTNFITGKLLTFKPSENPQDLKFSTSLLGTSLSTLYYNRGNHSYLNNVENFEAIAPDFREYAQEKYDVANTYALNVVVYSENLLYKSAQAANTGNALTNLTWWTPVDAFSDWITARVEDAIENTLQKTVKAAPFIDDEILLRVPDQEEDLVENVAGRKVGLMFNPKGSHYLHFILNRLGLAFKGIEEEIDFEIWNQNELITTIPLTPEDGGLNWFDLQSIDDTIIKTELSGPWFILYDQTGLTTQAMGKNTLFPQYHTWTGRRPRWAEFYEVNGINIATGSDLNDVDIDDLVFDNNFGLNLDFSIVPDLTPFIIKNRLAFSEVLHLQFAYDILQIMLDNPDVKVNRNLRNLDENELKYQLRSDDRHTLISNLSWKRKQLKEAIAKMGWLDGAFRGPITKNYNIGTV